MKSGIDKTEIDEKLAEGFKIIDELGVEYRSYFAKSDILLSSHEGNLIDTFHTWESNILNLFTILSTDKHGEIQQKRLIEAEYLSYIKEKELEAQEAKELLLQQPKLDAKGKPIVEKKKEVAKPKKGDEKPPLLVPPKHIPLFKTLIGFDYVIDLLYEEIANYMIRDICEHKELSEDNIISNIINFKSPIPQRPDSKSKPDLKEKKVQKEEVKEDIPELQSLIDNNPYKVLPKKEFVSPLSMKQTKGLSVSNLINYLII
jgi:hypothetical protein